MLEFYFWGALFMVFFAYFGYPLTLLPMAKLRKQRKRKKIFYPAVTLIITAYNEEKRIREKLENTLALNYPRMKLQILVASDGSADDTNKIVEEYTDGGIELLSVKSRRGKENAQKEAVRVARGEILVFSDVATLLDSDGLVQIVANFSDPTVGCVSSEDRLIDNNGKQGGEGLYVRYEMLLRQLETRANSLVGMSGSFFAARKEVCEDFSEDQQSDFRTLLNSIKMGMRGVCDTSSIGYYKDISDEKGEFRRKVRTVLRGITVFFRHLELLNFFRFGLFSYQLFCHKLLRWLVPVFLCIAFLSNIIFAFKSAFYLVLLIGQLLFYAIGILGSLRKQQSDKVILKIPLYFITVNAAIVVAWWQYIIGKRTVMWEPTKR